MSKTFTWRAEYRGIIEGREEDPDASYRVIVSQAGNGTWDWVASDFETWNNHESHGNGTETTLELAQEAARKWFFEGRFATIAHRWASGRTAAEGVKVSRLGVDEAGQVSLDALKPTRIVF